MTPQTAAVLQRCSIAQTSKLPRDYIHRGKRKIMKIIKTDYSSVDDVDDDNG